METNIPSSKPWAVFNLLINALFFSFAFYVTNASFDVLFLFGQWAQGVSSSICFNLRILFPTRCRSPIDEGRVGHNVKHSVVRFYALLMSETSRCL